MKLLIVQLSDIHMRQSDNPIVLRRQALLNAIRSVDPAPRACIIAYTGDIVDVGAAEEYYTALDFINGVTAGLQSALAPTTAIQGVLIPGNHDCDLSGPQIARDLLRDGLNNNPDQPIDTSVIDVCTDVQRGFFELRDLVSEPITLRDLGKLYYEYCFQLDGVLIEVRCLNTSWLSQRHELEGTLHYPAQIIPDRNAEATVSIALMHHPFAWFNTTARRALQRRLEEVADVILSGHEHTESRRTQTVDTGETNQFIEGAALQVWGDSRSAFNVLAMDTDTRQQQFLHFAWHDDHYACVHRGDWEAFQVNRLRARRDFEPNADFLEFLEDPGAGFQKADVGRPRLSQLFVYPELRRITLRNEGLSAPIAGEAVLDALDPPHSLITGAEQSGKTCFAKTAFVRFHRAGFIPLYVDGTQFSPQRGDRLHEQLYRLFGQQYSTESEDKFRQLERGRRVLIVDSFHSIRVPPGEAGRFLDDLEAFAGRICLLTNDLAHALEEILRAANVIEQRPSYAHFRLMPFGYAKRIELTTRWFTMGGALEDEVLARKLTDAEEKMEVVLGKHFVPAFPVFLLALLQGLDSSSMQLDVGASTYGYFYEILIKTALAKNATQAQVNVRYAYLTHLAYSMYATGRQTITDTELREFHKAHVKRFDLDLPYQEVIEDFRQRLVLARYSDTYEFKYQYFYYYFVARYLSVGLASNRQTAQPTVEALISDIANEEKANVLLFLAHLSPDPIIVDRMITAARDQFSDSAPATLEDDVAFLSQVPAGVLELEFEDGSFAEKRRELAEERDRVEWESGEHPGDQLVRLRSEREEAQQAYDETQRMLNRMIAGLKTLQILGQVLKNHPSSFDAETKERIAIECYNLGFRVLGYLLNLVKDGRQDMVRYAIQAIRERRPDEEAQKVIARANAMVFGLTLLGAFGIVKRISAAVGSPELSLTYPRVASAIPTMATKLANMSIRLDGSEFPRGDLLRLVGEIRSESLPTALLKWLVWSHVNLFPVNFRDRQEVFEAVGIGYRPSIGARPDLRMLPERVRQE